MCYGTVQQMRADVATLEMESPLESGAVLEWQMIHTHRDSDELLTGRLKVINVQLKQPAGTYRVKARLLDVPLHERERIDEWLQSRDASLATRRYETSVDSVVSSWTQTDPIYDSDSTGRTALGQLNQRRWQRTGKKVAEPQMVEPQIGSSQGRRTGRRALRDALRATMARKRRRAEATSNARSLPSWAIAQQARDTRRADPEVQRVPHITPPRVRVRYRDQSVYARDYERHIKSAALEVPLRDLGEDGARLTVSLIPPGGAPVLCDAEIKVQLPSGVGVALMLNPDQKQALQPRPGAAPTTIS